MPTPKLSSRKVPYNACLMRVAGVALQETAGAAVGTDKKARFELTVLSGKPILGHWFWDNLGIELAGVQHKATVPALLNHDPDCRVGFSDKVELKDGLQVSGPMMMHGEHAQVILADSKAGFPWEASARLYPLVVEVVQAGATAIVNGQPMVGPGHVFRQSQLREVSFVTFGADDQTTAKAFAGSAPAEIEAQFQEQEMPEVTPAPAPQIVPPATPVVLAAVPPPVAPAAPAPTDLVAAERQRASAILTAAGNEFASLGATLVANGTPLAEALGKIAAEATSRLASVRSQFRNGGDTPLGVGNNGAPAPATDPQAAILAMPEGKDRWQKEWDTDTKLAAEFMSKESYFAFRQFHNSRRPRSEA